MVYDRHQIPHRRERVCLHLRRQGRLRRFRVRSEAQVSVTISPFFLGLTDSSNTLWHNATTQPDGSGAVFYFHDGAVEHSDAVRLLLDVLGGYRLPHWDDGAWPSSHVLLHTLQLARKYEFDLTYNLIVTFCHLLIDRREKSRHLLDMFRLGAILDDELLATLAISRISEEHGNDGEQLHHPRRKLIAVEVSNWSAEQVARIPTAYLWAFIRSVRTRKALGVDGAGNTADATVENVFRASLAEIKGRFWTLGLADLCQRRRTCFLSRLSDHRWHG